MRFIVSNHLRKIAEGILAGIGKDDYLEHVEKDKQNTFSGNGKSTPVQIDRSLKSVRPSKEKEKKYAPPPKIKPPRKQPSFKNKWDSNETRREYQQEYRLENGNK